MRRIVLSIFMLGSVVSSFAQWSKTGSRVQLTTASDSVLLNSTTSNIPTAKLTVHGGIRIADKSGVVSEMIVPPSTLTGTAQADENRINIQNAIDRTHANGGKVVLMAGNYPISKNPSGDYCLLLKRGVHFEGMSKEASILMPISSGVSYQQQLEVIRPKLISQTDAMGMGTIRNLRIEGNGKNFITGINVGQYANGFNDAAYTVNNVFINAVSIGILVQSWGSQIENSRIVSTTVGIALRHFMGVPPNATLSDGTNASTVRDCEILLSDTGIVISGGGNLVIGNSIDSRDTANAFGLWINSSNGYCSQAWCGVAQNNIIANYFMSSFPDNNGNPLAGTGISIGNSSNVYVVGNYFDGIQVGRMITFRNGVPEGFQAQSNFGRGGPLANSTYGTIGINTMNPRGQFDIAGSGDIYMVDNPNNSAQSLYMPGHVFIAPYGGANVSYLQARRQNNAGTTELQFRTYNSGTLSESMRINGSGSVGIGTTTPIQKLDVNGSAKVGTGAWDGGHLIMGNYHLWIDTFGKLRIKNGIPGADQDGWIVGQQ